MHVDFKITIWERSAIPQDLEPMVREMLKNGKITSANDLHAAFDDQISTDTMYDTSEQMSVEDNGGFTTIEAFEGEWEEAFFKNGE